MSENWNTVLQAKTPLFSVPVKEIFRYRELILALVKRNYAVQYKQTILGPLWLVFSMVINSGIFSFVFGYVGGFATEGVPYFLYYMTGSVVWEMFASCFSSNTSVLLDNSYLFGKVYFPRLIVPIANILFNGIRIIVKLGVVFVVWGIYYFRGMANMFGFSIVFLIPIALIAGVMGASLGLIVSCLTVKYRDFSHITGLLITGMMYVSPVMYSISQLPIVLQNVVYINPMSSIVELFRYCILGVGNASFVHLFYSLIFSIIICIVSLVIFNQTEKTFIDII